jgi:hypothetical protein
MSKGDKLQWYCQKTKKKMPPGFKATGNIKCPCHDLSLTVFCEACEKHVVKGSMNNHRKLHPDAEQIFTRQTGVPKRSGRTPWKEESKKPKIPIITLASDDEEDSDENIEHQSPKKKIKLAHNEEMEPTKNPENISTVDNSDNDSDFGGAEIPIENSPHAISPKSVSPKPATPAPKEPINLRERTPTPPPIEPTPERVPSPIVHTIEEEPIVEENEKQETEEIEKPQKSIKETSQTSIKGKTACFECRKAHQACSGGIPCKRCASKNIDCAYRARRNKSRGSTQLDLYRFVEEQPASLIRIPSPLIPHPRRISSPLPAFSSLVKILPPVTRPIIMPPVQMQPITWNKPPSPVMQPEVQTSLQARPVVTPPTQMQPPVETRPVEVIQWNKPPSPRARRSDLSPSPRRWSQPHAKSPIQIQHRTPPPKQTSQGHTSLPTEAKKSRGVTKAVRMRRHTLSTILLRARLKNYITVQQYQILDNYVKEVTLEEGQIWEVVGDLNECMTSDNKEKWKQEGSMQVAELVQKIANKL